MADLNNYFQRVRRGKIKSTNRSKNSLTPFSRILMFSSKKQTDGNYIDDFHNTKNRHIDLAMFIQFQFSIMPKYQLIYTRMQDMDNIFPCSHMRFTILWKEIKIYAIKNTQRNQQIKQSQLQLFRIFINHQPSQSEHMKAAYRQHQGFQHLHSYTFNNNNFNATHNSREVKQIDDTSNKKYPNNKYFQFNDQDSSGRKYLKQKLNLYDDEEDYDKADKKNSQFQSVNKINQQIPCTNENNIYKQDSRDGIKSIIKYDQDNKYFRPKQTKTKHKMHKSCNKSYSKLKLKAKKTSANISTMETKCTTKNNIYSSRHKYNQLTETNQNQLKHYKKLCLDMRKKNTQLTKELDECKQQNRKSICQLQRKVDKLSQKYIQRKQNADCNKTQKIMESLKAIKGKLNKKENSREKEEKKFYDFFIESLGIMQPESETHQKYSHLEIQVIWKQMLQFLITHDFKLQNISKIKTLR